MRCAISLSEVLPGGQHEQQKQNVLSFISANRGG